MVHFLYILVQGTNSFLLSCIGFFQPINQSQVLVIQIFLVFLFTGLLVLWLLKTSFKSQNFSQVLNFQAKKTKALNFSYYFQALIAFCLVIVSTKSTFLYLETDLFFSPDFGFFSLFFETVAFFAWFLVYIYFPRPKGTVNLPFCQSFVLVMFCGLLLAAARFKSTTLLLGFSNGLLFVGSALVLPLTFFWPSFFQSFGEKWLCPTLTKNYQVKKPVNQSELHQKYISSYYSFLLYSKLCFWLSLYSATSDWLSNVSLSIYALGVLLLLSIWIQIALSYLRSSAEYGLYRPSSFEVPSEVYLLYLRYLQPLVLVFQGSWKVHSSSQKSWFWSLCKTFVNPTIVLFDRDPSGFYLNLIISSPLEKAAKLLVSATGVFASGIVISDYYNKEALVNAGSKKIQATLPLAAMVAQKNSLDPLYAQNYNALVLRAKEHQYAQTVDQKLHLQAAYYLDLQSFVETHNRCKIPVNDNMQTAVVDCLKELAKEITN